MPFQPIIAKQPKKIMHLRLALDRAWDAERSVYVDSDNYSIEIVDEDGNQVHNPSLSGAISDHLTAAEKQQAAAFLQNLWGKIQALIPTP